MGCNTFGKEIGKATQLTSLSGSDLFGISSANVTYSFSFDNLVQELGVTGTLTDGAGINGTPVLQGVTPNDYVIRGISTSSDLSTRIDANNNVEISFASSGVLARNGFIDYNDTLTSTTPINLVANTWTTITNDGAGAFTNKNYAPTGVTELMNVSTGAFDPTQLDFGDTMLIRNDFAVTPNTNNALLELRYQLGTGAGSYTLQKTVGRLDSGSGVAYRFSLEPDQIYMGDANTRDNPIVLQLRLSGDGTVSNAGSAITVVKR